MPIPYGKEALDEVGVVPWGGIVCIDSVGGPTVSDGGRLGGGDELGLIALNAVETTEEEEGALGESGLDAADGGKE